MSLLSSKRIPHQPSKVLLTEVILDALSDAAYRVALDNPQLVERALVTQDTNDIHLGSIHEIHLDQSHNGNLSNTLLQYRTLMLEPTSRGHLDPGSTKIIVVRSGNPQLLTSAEVLSEEPIDSEGIEIDEGFLANAVVPNPFKLNGHVRDSSSASKPADNRHTPQVLFVAEPLASPASLPEDHCTLYIRTVDLGRVGLLNEDWVGLPINLSQVSFSLHLQAVASSFPEKQYRLVRIVANDQLVKCS